VKVVKFISKNNISLKHFSILRAGDILTFAFELDYSNQLF
jgi:hypothetical protein